MNPWDVQSKHIMRNDGVEDRTRCVVSGDISPTLNTCGGGKDSRASCSVILIEMTSTQNTIVTDGVYPTLTARMGTGGNQVNAILQTVQPSKA